DPVDPVLTTASPQSTSQASSFLADDVVDTSFHPYPSQRPFINTDYRRPGAKPVMSYPESNRDGVMSALRSLQEKMAKLEMERQEAESNLRTLTSETKSYRNTLNRQDRSSPTSLRNGAYDAGLNSHQQGQRSTALTEDSSPVSQSSRGFGFPVGSSFRPGVSTAPRRNQMGGVHFDVDDDDTDSRQRARGYSEPTSSPRLTSQQQANGLESQLSSAETRCQLLEKQLDYMKKMVQNAEVERSQAEQKAEVLQRQTEPSPLTPDYRAQLDRIGMLERDHLRLTATQTLAEAKIKELEEKLRDERNHRHMLQERALDLESAAISHKILLDTAPIPNKNTTSSTAKSKKMSAVKKKKKKPAPKKPLSAKSEPMKHYRLNLAEIPFVAGKSTAPSHAVGANVQKVLAMMKSHNLALCSSLYNGHSCNGDLGSAHGRCNSPSLSSGSSISLDQDLADLLAQLQDEFGQLSFEHQEYMRQIHEAKDPRIREDLERELDSLVVRMEAKGQQISKVRQHQQKLEDAKRQARKPGKKSDHGSHSAMGRLSSFHRHADDHNGNARPKSSKNTGQNVGNIANPSLNVLKDMRKLQSTLRRDDLCWE
ncbi:hypothetical protein BaRGS_00021027, partial [Batillaria attramentaria]